MFQQKYIPTFPLSPAWKLHHVNIFYLFSDNLRVLHFPIMLRWSDAVPDRKSILLWVEIFRNPGSSIIRKPRRSSNTRKCLDCETSFAKELARWSNHYHLHMFSCITQVTVLEIFLPQPV